MDIDKTLSKKTIEFAWDTISKHVLWRYMCGKKTLNDGGELDKKFKRVCHPLVDEDLDTEKNDSAFFESFNPMRSVNSLGKFVPKLDALKIFSKPVENTQKLDKTLRAYGEGALIQICDIFSIVARDILIHKEDPRHIKRTSNKTIGDVVGDVSDRLSPMFLVLSWRTPAPTLSSSQATSLTVCTRASTSSRTSSATTQPT